MLECGARYAAAALLSLPQCSCCWMQLQLAPLVGVSTRGGGEGARLYTAMAAVTVMFSPHREINGTGLEPETPPPPAIAGGPHLLHVLQVAAGYGGNSVPSAETAPDSL